MPANRNKWIYWIPRVLGLLFAAFISLFALDVFSEGYGFWETLVALFMHMIPTFLVLGLLALAWRWDRIGGVLFILLGIAYIFMARMEISAVLVISGPLFLIGALFLLTGFIPPRQPTV